MKSGCRDVGKVVFASDFDLPLRVYSLTLECAASGPPRWKLLFQYWGCSLRGSWLFFIKSLPRIIVALVGISLVTFWSIFNITLDSSEPPYFQLISLFLLHSLSKHLLGTYYLPGCRARRQKRWKMRYREPIQEIQDPVFTKTKE